MAGVAVSSCTTGVFLASPGVCVVLSQRDAIRACSFRAISPMHSDAMVRPTSSSRFLSLASRAQMELDAVKGKTPHFGICCGRGEQVVGRGFSKLRVASNGFMQARKTVMVRVGAVASGVSFKPRIRPRTRRICRLDSTTDSSLGEEARSKDSDSGIEGQDYITKLLRDTPSQTEPNYKIRDGFYTVKEKNDMQRPSWRKFVLSSGSSRAMESSEVDIGLQRESGIGKRDRGKVIESETGLEGESGARIRPVNPIYLSDLLRQYNGKLFIPEEVLEKKISEEKEFDRNLDVLPEMQFEDFWKSMQANQVKLLTSRGIPSASRFFSYWDFVVELKEIPGERDLQEKKWAMHLSEGETKALLQEYRGPQREVEVTFTPYTIRPSTVPHPVSSSISARLVAELDVLAGIISALAVAAGSATVGASLCVVVGGRFVIICVFWPLVYYLLRPFATLAVSIIGGGWVALVAVFSGQKGPGWLVAEGFRLWKSGILFSSARTLGAIIFVLIAMAALAKFTLTRRPKDFTKWDLWQAIEFGHSKPQARVEGTTGIGFGDVAGIDDVVKELQELVSYLKAPERFNRMGTRPPHGVLLEGPPGCGKTLLAKAIAGEAGVPFYQMAGSEFVEVLVGVGAARIRDLFKRAKVNRPSVVFIDEIDALGAIRHRAVGEEGVESYNAGAQERETTLNQLLIELDGFDTGKGVVFMGATNRVDMLDPALLRPGRFDRKMAIRPPRAKGRFEILKVHAKSVKLDDSVDLWLYAKNLPGWSGAELAQLLQEAALVAVRYEGTIIKPRDVDQALDRLTMGAERLGLDRHQPIHHRMATHEVGLAMTSHLLRRLENAQLEFCSRVSIVPRGVTLARTIFDKLDDESYMFEQRPTIIHRMQVMLGGRAAEEVMYGRDTSTFSAQYLRHASWLARKIVSIWNLEGVITIQGDLCPWEQNPSFIGPPMSFEGGLYDNYGFDGKTLNYGLVDNVAKSAKALLDQIYEQTLGLLKENQAALRKAIYVVIEKEELFGEELEFILDQYPSTTAPQLVDKEEEPGLLGSQWSTIKEIPQSFGQCYDDMSSTGESLTSVSGEDNVDEWLLKALRSNDAIEVNRMGGGGYSEDGNGSREESLVDNILNVNVGGEREHLDREESPGTSLEVDRIAATDISGLEEPYQASIPGSGSLMGKHDKDD